VTFRFDFLFTPPPLLGNF
jgi:hypothetical protein